MRRVTTILALAGLATALSACGRKAETPPSASPATAASAPTPPPSPAAGSNVPAPTVTADATPALPVWSSGWIGKPLTSIFPKTAACRGNTDWVTLRYNGEPKGVQVRGWAFDPAAKQHVEQILLVSGGVIAGAGSGGLARPQVMKRVPEVTDPNTQWFAVLPKASGFTQAYGVIAPDTVCPLGHVTF